MEPAAQPVDRVVGENVRRHRLRRGLSQTSLAEKIGLTFQQVQKYERGANRISASKLFDISKALEVDVRALFDGLVADAAPIEQPLPDPLSRRLTEAFARIESRMLRQRILDLVELLAANDNADPGAAT